MNKDQLNLSKVLVQNFPPIQPEDSAWLRIKKRWYRLVLINENHPERLEYFRSDIAVLQEKKRQYDRYWLTVHPLSKVSQVYEVWSFLFYLTAIFIKILEFGWVSTDEVYWDVMKRVLYCVTTLDVISFINTCLQFFIGYRKREDKKIELSLKKIAKNYFLSGHFFCDLFSSIPRLLFYRSSQTLYLVINSTPLLKLRRVPTVIRLIEPTFRQLYITNETVIFMFGFFTIVVLILHVITCFHEGLTRYITAYYPLEEKRAFRNSRYQGLNVTTRYVRGLFQNTQYTYLVHVEEALPETVLIEEEVLSMVNYCIGKLLVMVLWSVLLQTFLSKNTLKTKYQAIMTELREYMKAKHLPKNVRTKLEAYYRFRYQQMFFSEVVVMSTFSENLRREIDLFLCKSFISQVDIFSRLPPKVLKELVKYLQPEICLPNDLIIQSGSHGDVIYFIESGTVAVSTPSGKEVCHLQDGAYFGEVSMVLKNKRRTATVVAVEYTRLYKLRKVYFMKCFVGYEDVYQMVLDRASRRASHTLTLEEMYRKEIFKKTYHSSTQQV